MASEDRHVDLSGVEKAQEFAAAAEGGKDDAEERLRKAHEELYRRICDGETTGDRFADFVILRNRRHNPEAAELFRSLEARVAAHVGEPVMVIARDVDYHTHSFPHGLKDPYVVERMAVGILKGSKLSIDPDGRWSFPTGTHVDREHGDDDVIEKPLTTALPGRYMHDTCPLEGALDTPMRLPDGTSVGFAGGSREGVPVALEIAIGNEEIEELLESRLRSGQDKEVYASMLDRLTRFRLPSRAMAPERISKARFN